MVSAAGPGGGWNGVATFLLEHNADLTAFELMHELIERGEEGTVAAEALQRLRRYFSDVNKFPPDEVRKFEASEEYARQKVVREKEALAQKLGVVEYDLRLAREDIADLTAKLEKQAEDLERATFIDSGSAPGAEQAPNGTDEDDPAAASIREKPLTQLEISELSCAVKDFLVQQGLRLTAMTMCDESGSNLDQWPGGTRVPHALARYYRLHKSSIAAAEVNAELLEERDRLAAELKSAQEQLAAATDSATSLEAIRASQEEEMAALRSALDAAESELSGLRARASNSALDPCESCEGAGVRKNNSGGGGGADPQLTRFPVALVAECLPRIIPNVLLNKREELLPLIVATAQHHRDAGARDALLATLFSLLKKPSSEQRRHISQGLASLARAMGERRCEEELLPHVVEQVPHKHPERRVLGADACGDLAPYLRPEIRQSLLLSILQQLAEDASPIVRDAAARNLGRLVPSLADADKYPQLESLCFTLALDADDGVAATCLAHLLPAITKWLRGCGRLHTALLPSLLARVNAIVEASPKMSMAVGGGGSLQMACLGEGERWHLDVLLRMMLALIKPLRAAVVAAEYARRGEEYEEEAEAEGAEGGKEKQEGGDGGGDGGHVDAAVGGAVDSLEEDSSKGLDRTGVAAVEGAADSNTVEASGARAGREAEGGADAANDDAPTSAGTTLAAPAVHPVLSSSLSLSAALTSLTMTASSQAESAPAPTAPSATPHFLALQSLLESYTTGLAPSALLDAICLEYLPTLLRLTSLVHTREDGICHRLCQVFRGLCDAFGPVFVESVMRPFFVAAMGGGALAEGAASTGHALGRTGSGGMVAPVPVAASGKSAGHLIVDPGSGGGMGAGAHADAFILSDALLAAIAVVAPINDEAQHGAVMCLMPQFLAAVLPCLGQPRLRTYLRELVTGSSQREGAWDKARTPELVHAFAFLCSFEDMQGVAHSILVDDLMGSPFAPVRVSCAVLFGAMAGYVKLEELPHRIMEPLMIMGADSNLEVKAASISALGEVAKQVRDYDAIERIKAQIDAFLEDGSHEVTVAVIRMFANAGPPAEPSLRDFILQKLLLLANGVKLSASQSARQQEKAAALFEALRSLENCDMSAAIVANVFLPALEALQHHAELLEAESKELLATILSDRKTTLAPPPPPPGAGGSQIVVNVTLPFHPSAAISSISSSIPSMSAISQTLSQLAGEEGVGPDGAGSTARAVAASAGAAGAAAAGVAGMAAVAAAGTLVEGSSRLKRMMMEKYANFKEAREREKEKEKERVSSIFRELELDLENMPEPAKAAT
eukprot:jgi/Mesvir1/12918/Mv05937-RA.1